MVEDVAQALAHRLPGRRILLVEDRPPIDEVELANFLACMFDGTAISEAAAG